MRIRRFGNLGLAFYGTKLKKGARSRDDGCALNIKCPRRFSLAELRRVTNNFSDTNVIGSGGYGKVYKATLDDGQIVAIKRAERGSTRWMARFTSEIELLSRFHHNNVLDLIGYCVESGERTLVYDYMQNGSLKDILLGKMEIQLDWGRRVGIAFACARALKYLHYDVNPRVIHRNIKSSNILLNNYGTGKVAHFDLAKILPGGPDEGDSQVISTQIAGTLGYLDPEYMLTGHLSLKSDVYSFGVVLLELITARPVMDINGGPLVPLVKATLETWGINVLKDELMDPLLRDSQVISFERFLSLALTCVQGLSSQRPSMREVVKELESILISTTEMEGFSHPTPPPADEGSYDDEGYFNKGVETSGTFYNPGIEDTIEEDRGSFAEEGR